ncbi:hypothetical protein B9479_002216 [Cryptococcus floricola]|uniref:Uncharacterized protein n=1 Tax=Cryptococcus floricola TaxID=2591691 RepID=A0A5D3B0I4_9TREE|nr:hypothetical protein B9479_002216 [Cryptococcus floricola]
MSEAYQEPSASSSPSGTQAGTSADESRGGSTTDTGPFPAMVWTRYGYRIDDDSFCQTNDIFCPCSADAVTHTPEDMRKYVSRLTGAPLESITVTLLSEYKANVKTSQWDASYHNGEKSQGRTPSPMNL